MSWVPWFYLHVLYFNRSTIEVSSYNSSPLYARAQPVLRCACPSCRCQPRKQPVWHLQKCSWSAPGQPVSILMQRGAQNWDVLPVSFLWGVLACLSSPHCSTWLDIAQLGLGLTECIYSRGRVWSIPQRAAETNPVRPNMKPELPTSFSAVSMSQVDLPLLHKKKNTWGKSCVLFLVFFFLLELWHLV